MIGSLSDYAFRTSEATADNICYAKRVLYSKTCTDR